MQFMNKFFDITASRFDNRATLKDHSRLEKQRQQAANISNAAEVLMEKFPWSVWVLSWGWMLITKVNYVACLIVNLGEPLEHGRISCG